MQACKQALSKETHQNQGLLSTSSDGAEVPKRCSSLRLKYSSASEF